MFPKITKRIAVSLFTGAMSLAPLCALAGPVSQESETLAAQVNVTRDQVNQLVSKLKDSQAGATKGFSHPDFITKSRAFNLRVEKAMMDFETAMANDVLRPASLWVDRLKAIDGSSAYSQEQRTALFADQYKQAATAFKMIEKTYQSAILKVYMTVLPTVEVKYSSVDSSCSDKYTRFCKANFQLITNDPRAGFDKIFVQREFDSYYKSDLSNLSQKYADVSIYDSTIGYVPQLHSGIYANDVRKDCMSSACIALYSTQLTSFVSLVASTLDKTIDFKVGKGTLSLEPLNFKKDLAVKYFSALEDKSLNLPFDIQPTQYRQALIQQTASAYANSDSSTTCQSEGDRLKALACFSEAGCLNENEKAVIETAIQNGKGWGSAKSEKAACLRK